MRWRNGHGPGYLLAVGLGLVSLQCGGPVAKEVTQQDCRPGKLWHRDDVVRLLGCRRIDGNLELGGALDSAIGLENLELVSGDLIVGPSYQLDNLSSLAALVKVGGDVRIEGNWRLGGVFLPGLETVGGRIAILNNSGLTNCAFARLRSFSGLEVVGNRSLQRVDLSSLDRDGAAGRVSGPSLSDVIAPPRIRWEKTSSAETRAKGS